MNLAAVAKLFDILPGWVWAAIVAGALLHGCAVGMQRDGARLEAATVKAAAAAEHAEHLDAMVTQTNLVLKKTNELRELRAAQDRKDSDAKSTIASLSEDLRRRSRGAGGAGLRDPFAPACSGEPAPGSGAAAGAGGADPAQAGRLLSENLEQLLLALAADADGINIAYASCREDAVNLRAQFKSLQLSPPPPGPASSGSP